MKKVADAYRHGEIGDPENRRYAGSLDNAATYTGTFIAHPGMPGNTNEVERIIRGRVVKPRNIQRILPDWAGARTLEMLQTPSTSPAPPAAYSPGMWLQGRRGCWDLEPGSPKGRMPGKPPPASEPE